MEINIVKESNSLTLTTNDVINGFNSGTNSVSSSSSSSASPSTLSTSNTNSDLEDNLANHSGLSATLDSCLSNDFFSLNQIPSSHSLFDSFSTADFADLNDDFDCLANNELNGMRHDVSVGTDLCLSKDMKRKLF
jgi:hypothetical protein